MKVERWEEESDEEWTQRLAEETALANDVETTKYFVERDPYEEDGIIINYIGETGWTWKEHPEGPFKAKQILGWKNDAEKLPIYVKQFRHMTEHALELEDKLEVIKNIAENWKSGSFDGNIVKEACISADALNSILEVFEGSGFTTNPDKEVKA